MGGVDEEIAAVARKQNGAITRAQAFGCGASEDLINGRLKRGCWVRLYRGVYQVDPSADPFRVRLHGLTAHTRGVACRRAAARLFEMDAFDELDTIELDTLSRPDPAGAVIHFTQPPPQFITRRYGIPVTQPEWTLLHLGSVASRDDVECALDCCLRRRWTRFDRLLRLCDQYERRGRDGVYVLRDLLELRAPLRCHTDSILETRCLQAIRNAGLPIPVLQHPIIYNGRIIARADLAYPHRGVLIETLGHGFHRQKRWQLTRDCERENAIELLKRFTVLKFSHDQVMDTPEVIPRDVARALGIAIQQALPLRWTG